jgi:hypothetical protein
LGKTVRELLNSLTSREISEWKAFYMLEQEECKRGDLGTAAQEGLAKMKRERKK